MAHDDSKDTLIIAKKKSFKGDKSSTDVVLQKLG
jgi:hypothetical protein